MDTTSTLDGTTSTPARSDNITVLAHLVYLMYVLPTGITALFGLVLAYACRSQARGTYVDAHFRWQIRTFWVVMAVASLVGVAAVAVVGGLAMAFQNSTAGIVFTVGVAYAFLCLFLLLSVWFLYRTVRGWVLLYQQREI